MKRLLSLVAEVLLLAALAALLAACEDTTGPDDSSVKYGWAVGDSADGYGTIVHTNDGGETWVRQGSPSTLPNVVFGDVAAADEWNVWVVGGDAILHTTDGGGSWARQGTDGSVSYESVNSVSAVSAEIAWVVGAKGAILKTVDGGETWAQQAEGILPNAHPQRVFALDASTVWVVGADGSDDAFILCSTDGGGTWARQGDSVIPAGVDRMLDVHAVDANIVWAVGGDFSGFRSTDGGGTWVYRPLSGSGFYDANGVIGINGLIAWGTTDDHIYYTENAGDEWIAQTVTDSVFGYYLKLSALDESTAWIAKSNVVDKTGSVFRTTDGGENWDKTTVAGGGLWAVSFVGALR